LCIGLGQTVALASAAPSPLGSERQPHSGLSTEPSDSPRRAARRAAQGDTRVPAPRLNCTRISRQQTLAVGYLTAICYNSQLKGTGRRAHRRWRCREPALSLLAVQRPSTDEDIQKLGFSSQGRWWQSWGLALTATQRRWQGQRNPVSSGPPRLSRPVKSTCALPQAVRPMAGLLGIAFEGEALPNLATAHAGPRGRSVSSILRTSQ